MFRVKICGITNVDDALAVAAAGGDAIGLNFFARSRRCVAIDVAERIVNALSQYNLSQNAPGNRVVKVGLFVNADADEVCRTYDRLGLDLVQLHGDEPPEYLGQLGGRPVMRAFRIGSAGIAPVLDYLEQCRARDAMPRLVLLDAQVPGAYGGTGKTTDWTAAAGYAAMPNMPPLVLAGGLTPQNVGEAISAVHPAAVDTASGVERSPGRKDPAAVAAFVQAAQSRLYTLDR